MNTAQIVVVSVSGTLLVAIVLCYIFGKDYLKFSRIGTTILNALLSVLKAVGGLFPNAGALNVAATVISCAIDAAGHAENLWLQGEIDKSMRPHYAEEYITGIFNELGIEVTDSIRAIVSGAIAATCYLMPHHGEDTVIENKGENEA